MKKAKYLIIFLFAIGSGLSAQSVISDAAFSSHRRSNSTLTSSPMGIGSAPPAYNISPMGNGGYNPTIRMNGYSPSGSRYSSNIYTPFAAGSPQHVVRRVITSDDDGDDDGEDPVEDPGNPGPPMPIGNGIWVMILLCIGYVVVKARNRVLQ